ncbi:MAG: LON peptidase substrate-binding domain-containing protein [Verrucomicrobia bacterium]|nr:LON peptidase substrate-binding domain-containing protein [Verrucomicrobiota bacterium]
MDLEINLPEVVPAMTLPNTVFFPQALLPLHIFEPRYRHMLKDVLASNRLFAVAGLDSARANLADQFEPPHRIASVGIVRACQENDNGTSNLLLQGLCRVEILEVLTDEPYRRLRIKALPSLPLDEAETEVTTRLHQDLAKLIGVKQKLGATVPPEMAAFLRGIEDPETLVDLAAFSLCDNPGLKQKLLETLDIRARLELFTRHLRREIDEIRLRQKLQGHLPDDRISHN